ncbi:WD40 repeat domain-containing protein [Urbifossiella limnaea]|uniref:Translocation protein TolB n=1 Tax=Urbifossiella limnaea TaxID=2528023 RepID=A0A517XP00_9BACT|nr:WD40 repeat domain-containing protein [Urbifossiella limnaea]QDU19206.1 translocation protein TolB [Urbifossiella limnaea]
MSTPSPAAPTDDAAKPSPLVGRVYGEPRFHADGDVAAVAFAPDGSVRSVDESGVLHHWAADGRQLARHYLSDLETLWAFSPDAGLLASGNDDLILWDAAAGQLVRRFAQDSWVTAVAFSADGRTVASGHDDGTVRLWDVASQKPLGKFLAHPKPISAVAFSPTGDHLATAGEDRLVRVWDNFSHKLVGDLRSHTDRIPALAWSPDGALLVSAGWDTSARVWKVGTPDPLMLLNSHADQVTQLAWSPDGKRLACADSDFDIYLWSDAAAGTVAHVLRGHADDVRTLAFSPDGTRLASAGLDRVVHVWDTQTGKLVAGPNPTGRHAIAVVPGPAPKLASTAGPSVRVWDATTGAEVASTGVCGAASVAASPDGKWLAVGGVDHRTRLCDAPTGAVARTLEATKPPVGAVAFSPDSKRLAHTSPADGLVWVWQTEGTGDAELILIEAADGCTLEGLAFHPDGNRLACGGIDYLSTGERDGAVCLWDLTTKERAFTLDVGVRAVAFDPAGKYLAAAGVTDTVFVWDVDTQEAVFELAGHQETVHAVAFDPSGSYLVSGGDDMTVRVWDVLSGRLLVSREFDSPVQALAFSADGSQLFLGNGNTTCYQVEFKKLLDD